MAGLLLAAVARAGPDDGMARTRLLLATPKGEVALEVELACRARERAHGYMGRQTIPFGTGMLFDFGRTRRVAMWMKNTPHPLDMLFLAADGTVRHVIREATPFSLQVREAPVPVRYVLELPAGSVVRYGITVGTSRLRLPAGGSPCDALRN